MSKFEFYKKYTVQEVKALFDEIKKQYPVGKLLVDSSPRQNGKKQCLYYLLVRCGISTHILGQDDIDGVDYTFSASWMDGTYKGTFTFVPINEGKKPEPFKVGDLVKVCEAIQECGDFSDWNADIKGMIGNSYSIWDVADQCEGVFYELGEGFWFPHYALKKVINEAKPKKVILELTDEQLAKIQTILNN